MKILSLNLGVEKTGSSLLGAQKLVGNQKCKSLPGVYLKKEICEEWGEKGKLYIQVLHKVLESEAGKIMNSSKEAPSSAITRSGPRSPEDKAASQKQKVCWRDSWGSPSQLFKSLINHLNVPTLLFSNSILCT